MNTKKTILIILAFIFNIGIIYSAFLIGKNHAVLTDNQIKCLAVDVIKGEIIISQEQAMCLARNGEIKSACGLSCPIKKTFQNSTEFTLKAFKKVFVKESSFEFERKVKDLGVKFIKK